MSVSLRDPAMLGLAVLVVPALWLRFRRGGPALHFGAAHLLGRDRLPVSWRTATRGLPGALHVLGLLLLVVALARPMSREPLPLEKQGIDILLCLDTSSSMQANDMDLERTRLEVAKDAAQKFIRDRDDDRIGLITFARYADLRCPLTQDHEALAEILAEVETVEGDGPEDATGIGTALVRAAEVLDASPTASRVVILLTDGEETVATDGMPGEIPPAHAGQLSERLGLRVYPVVVGIGKRSAAGRWTRLDTKDVRTLAARTGGAFHEARSAGAVEAVYARIDRLETSPFAEARFTMEDRYLPFLLLAFGLIAIGRLLGKSAWEVLP